MVTELTNENFMSEISTGKVFIDIYATWCGPCKTLSPIVDELSEQYEGIKFCKADAEEADELAAHFKVRNLPTLIFMKDGELIAKEAGAPNRKMLEERIIERFN